MTICGPNQQLTSSQVAGYMKNAGFPDSAIPIGVAVAYAESGWETGNCNLADANGGSYGLWQINGAHFHAGGTTKACAFDPQCATNYAYQLWSGQGWQPWGGYTDGRYLQYLNGAIPGAAGPSGTIPNNTPSDPMSLQNLLTAGSNLYDWLKDPVRIIKMIVGIGLVLISVAVLFLPQAETQVRKVVTPIRKYYLPKKVGKK